MIAKADTITHGSNAVRYSADKEMAEIVKVGHLPEKANDILMKEATLPDDVLWSKLADVQNTAILLFANYLDAATQMSVSCGGGGSSAMESGWGRKEDEDDMAWARRCSQQAFGMHKRRSRGVHR